MCPLSLSCARIEIGERGKAKRISEGVPPAPTNAKTPTGEMATVPAPASTPARSTPAVVQIADQSSSPTVQPQVASQAQQSMQLSLRDPSHGGANILQVSAFVMEHVKEQHEQMISLLMKQHEAKLHCVTDEQLVALSQRLENLHSSSLLTDDVSVIPLCTMTVTGRFVTEVCHVLVCVGAVGA